jgi:dCTP deaminase
MILADTDISTEFLTNSIIVPFTQSQLQSASYDVRLGNKFWRQKSSKIPIVAQLPPQAAEMGVMQESASFRLDPGEFALGYTVEKVNIPNTLVARLEGKSSLGRLGLLVHATAGYIDPGFRGHITLELSNIGRIPLLLNPGMLIGQLSFTKLFSKPEKLYGDKSLNSHYQDQPDRPVLNRKEV